MALPSPSPRRPTARAVVLLAAAGAVAAGLALAPRIPQDPDYHRFADERTVLGVPNFWNVVSNLPFVAVGLAGIAFLLSRRSRVALFAPGDRVAYAAFFLGVLGTAFGSAWYHVEPTTERLFWDRLPMAVGFMGLTAAVVGERVDRRAAAALTVPLVALGLSSVLHWRATEGAGAGDLRLYAGVQYAPVALIPLAIALFPAPGARSVDLFVAFVWYALAKGLEALDRPIHEAGGLLSGHTLKHVAAALGAWQILRMLRRCGGARAG
jgi:hypothetical protein